MGIWLSLRQVGEVARTTAPSWLQSWFGKIPKDVADRRMSDFARRCVANARMKITVEGAEKVPSDGSYVFLSNHQSHMDIPVIYHTCPVASLRMVGKKSLFRVPFWGRAMKAGGFVEIDRTQRDKAIAQLGQAEGLLGVGTSVWIAAEGKRSRSGELLPLKKGGFHVAKKSGMSIVPIALLGTRAMLPPETLRCHYDMPVRVVYGAPISVEHASIEELMQKVESFLQEFANHDTTQKL